MPLNIDSVVMGQSAILVSLWALHTVEEPAYSQFRKEKKFLPPSMSCQTSTFPLLVVVTACDVP
jgi:hypothetical protein